MPALSPRRIVAFLLAFAALGYGIERLVVTDREAIEELLERAAATVSHDDWDGFAATVDDDFAARGRNKPAFVAFVRTLKDRYKPGGVGLEIGGATINDDRAAAPVVVLPGAPYVGMRVGGHVDLVRTGAGWRIAAATVDEQGLLGR